MILEPLDFSLLCLKHLLYKEHLSFLVDELVAVFLVFGSFNRNSETSSLTYIDLTLYLRVDGESTGLDISLTDFTKATLSGGSILFPDLERLVTFLLMKLPFLLFLLERENLLVGGCTERVLHRFIGSGGAVIERIISLFPSLL